MSDWKAVNAQRLSELYPLLGRRGGAFLDSMFAQGVPCLITRGLASFEEQAALYAKGRTPEEIANRVSKHGQGGAVTDAPPGWSGHPFGMAFDIVPSAQVDNPQPDWNASHADWQLALATGPKFGLAEGAKWPRFKDTPHLYLAELNDTPTDAMRAAYASGGLPAVWAVVDHMLQIPLDPEITAG